MHVGQLRDAPEEIATHQIDQICTPQVISTEGLLTAPNGGSLRGRATTQLALRDGFQSASVLDWPGFSTAE
jgi:hypothetical protein